MIFILWLCFAVSYFKSIFLREKKYIHLIILFKALCKFQMYDFKIQYGHAKLWNISIFSYLVIVFDF